MSVSWREASQLPLLLVDVLFAFTWGEPHQDNQWSKGERVAPLSLLSFFSFSDETNWSPPWFLKIATTSVKYNKYYFIIIFLLFRSTVFCIAIESSGSQLGGHEFLIQPQQIKFVPLLTRQSFHGASSRRLWVPSLSRCGWVPARKPQQACYGWVVLRMSRS